MKMASMDASLRWLPFLVSLFTCTSQLLPTSAADFELPNVTLNKIAFGSCHNSRKIHGPVFQSNIWKSIIAETPDIFIWTGDAVYPAQRKIANTTYLKHLMHDMLTNDTVGYNQLQPPHGIYGVYDDHDYGGNDAGVEMTDKRQRADLYLDFLQLPTDVPSALRSRQGLYYSVVFGTPPQQVKLIFLDTRWHRSKHCLPSLATKVPLGAGLAAFTRWMLAGFNVNQWWPLWDCWKEPTVLGDTQWTWLEDELLDSQANVHVVVSSIQVLTTNPTVEGWGHFPLERQRLIRLLGKGISGLFLLSGDVHHAELLNPLANNTTLSDHNKKFSFLEVTSSGMTHYCSQPFYGRMCEPLLKYYQRNRFDGTSNYYIGRNYGRLVIDWEDQTSEITVQNAQSKTVLQTGPRKFQQDVLTTDDVDQVAPCVDGHMIRPVLSMAVALMAILAIGLVFAKRKVTR
jgi:alkaline phosphatase D